MITGQREHGRSVVVDETLGRTRIYAHSAAERRHGWPNQAIDCNRTLAVQQYRFLRRHHGLRPGMARDRLYQILFIGVTGGRYVPSTTAVSA